MSIKFNQEKSILEIIEGTQKEILSNIDLLAKDYLEKTGKKLNKGCPACVIEMLLTLKNQYKMTKFKFKRHAASYKNKKGDKTTISNSTMTDEKAIEFLKTNPERIKLFSEFPKDWEILIITGAKVETPEEKANRIAIEAELKAKEDAEKLKAMTLKTKPVKKDLEKMKLADLRKAFPMVKDGSIKGFIAKVMKLPVEEPKKEEVPETTEKKEVTETTETTETAENVETSETKKEDVEADATAEATKAADEANKVEE